MFVVAGHLLDHAHDPGFVPVPLEVAEEGGEQPLPGGGARARREDDALHGLGELVVQRLRDLTEDLLLRVEVVVEGTVREARPLGDVGDARLEEAVLLENLLGGVEQPRSRLHALARARAVLRLAFACGLYRRHGSDSTGGIRGGGRSAAAGREMPNFTGYRVMSTVSRAGPVSKNAGTFS